MKLVRIPTELLDTVWTLVQPSIQEALVFSGNHTDSDFVLETLKADKYQLWIVWDISQKTTLDKFKGVVVTELIKKKLKQSCHIFIMTGKGRQQWQHLLSVIEDFAEQHGCDQMELIARPGWARILKQYKYKRTHVVLEKQLNKQEKT